MTDSKLTRRKFLRNAGVAAAGVALSESLMGEALEGVRIYGLNLAGEEQVVTTCNMCALGCSVIATRASGKVIHLRGNPESPSNKGRLCAKGHAGLYKVIHPERLTRPLIRAGERGSGKWKAVSWDRALAIVSSSLLAIRRDFGPRSIAMWQNLNMDRPDIFRRFTYALGSPNYIGHVSTCDASRLIGGALTYGPARARYDFENAECIMAVGINPLAAKDLVLATRGIMIAREKGAVLITVDPRLSETAARSDLWLSVRPGTDGILLAGLAGYLIRNGKYDKEFVQRHTLGFSSMRRFVQEFRAEDVTLATGIGKSRFLQAARLLAERRSVVAIGRGVVTHTDATDVVRLAESLNALLGAFDREGGVLLPDFPPIKLAAVLPEIKDPGGLRIDRANADRLPLPVGPRNEYPTAFFGISHEVPGAILSEDPYALRAILFNSVNPIYSLPQGQELLAALPKVKLVVSMDAFMSETTQYADVVLPASTYLEGLDLWFPHAAKVSLRQPVVRPVGDSRPNQEIILALAHRMGFHREFPFKQYEDFVRAQLIGSGIEYDELKRKGFVPYSRDEERPGKLRETGFKTVSKRVELVSSVLSASGFSALPRLKKTAKTTGAYPFHLVTYKLPYHTQSATAENPYLAAIQRDNPAWINPVVAKKLSLEEGASVEILSWRGSIVARAHITSAVRPDTVALSHHFGHEAYSKRAAGRGVNGNLIISGGTDPAGGNLAYNDTIVQLRRL